ncbi:MAG: hypothetical protein JSU96_06145, partial [Acidobacteriota bacterium]
MRRTLQATLMAFLLLTASTQARDWEWVSGGNFTSIAVQNGEDASPANDVVWLTGNLLVKGVRQNDGWAWTQVAPELTENAWVDRLVFFEGTYAMALTGGTGVGYTGDGAVATPGTGIAYSENGGNTWTVSPIPDWIKSINRFQMTGPSHAYAVGRNTDEQAILVSTADGGTTWNLVFDSGEWPGIFTGLQVYENGNSTKATLVGNYFSSWMGWLGVIVETEDNFQTVRRTDYDDQALWRLEAPTEWDHYALGGPDLPGSQRPILVSRHEGRGWTQSTLPGDIYQITDMTFSSGLHGWVVGSFSNPDVGSGGVLLETTDGGETWERTDFCANCVTQLPIVEEPVSLLHYVGAAGGELFVGQNASAWPCAYSICTGRVLASSDGENWTRVEKLTGYGYVDIDLAANPSNGIAVGFDGNGFRSFTQRISGGVWQEPVFQEIACPFFNLCPARWASVQIIQGSEIWAITDSSYTSADLLKSSDYGMTWTSIDRGEEGAYQHPILSVASPDSIWTAVTTTDNAGKILGTTDRGDTWTTIQDGGVGARFTRVDHVSETQYCYVMRSMACTKDGGKTWSYPAGPSEYTGLQLLDNEYGWAVGVGHQDGVEVYRTTNGGTTWNKVAGLDQRTLESKDQLYFINRQEGWLGVGPNGSNPGGL